ncbi:MAG: hypothetical protein F6K09_31105 [Merismopedia sp. SIO2A8]|nr:hypothetical protein [Merismopedia sp. SIO2A8]
MRIDPIVALTLMLLSLIVAATSVSVSWGYALGRNALKGVTQPEVRPSTTPLQVDQTNQDNRVEDEAPTDMVFWSEADILEDVKRRINPEALSQ